MATEKKEPLTPHSASPFSENIVDPIDILLVIETILGHLGYRDLMTARLVSKRWSSLSTKILKELDLTIVNLEFDKDEKAFCQSGRRSNYLSELNEILGQKSSETKGPTLLSSWQQWNGPNKFPCTSFTFTGGHLGSPEVEIFFKIQGHFITTLRLITMEKMADKRSLKNILLKLASNIVALDIKGFETIQWHPKEKLELPNLKILSWRDDQRDGYYWQNFGFLPPQFTTSKILQNAPNLKEIQNFHPGSHMDVVIQWKKEAAIKEFVCGGPLDYPIDLELLKKFVQAGPKLTKLILTDIDQCVGTMTNEMVQNFSELIQSSQDTLEVLHLSDAMVTGTNGCSLVIPILDKLKELKIGPKFGLPRGLDMGQIFPNLVILDASSVSCGDGSDIKLQNCKKGQVVAQLANHHKLPHCQKLIIPAKCGQSWIRKFGQLCTNFKHLIVIVTEGHHLDKILRLIFAHWTHLEVLEIKFLEVTRLPAINMDAVFVGILDSLHCDPKQVDELRPSFELPGLKNLRDLKKLVLVFHLNKELNNFFPPLPDTTPFQFSWIIVEHAFKFMPDLKITIKADQDCQLWFKLRRLLEPLVPHVTLDPCRWL